MKTLLKALLFLIAFPTCAASFIGNRDDFRDESIYFVMTHASMTETNLTTPNAGTVSNTMQATLPGAVTSKVLLRNLTTSKLSALLQYGLLPLWKTLLDMTITDTTQAT